jgi:hypothetical protein
MGFLTVVNRDSPEEEVREHLRVTVGCGHLAWS